jgi:hypothetical protein
VRAGLRGGVPRGHTRGARADHRDIHLLCFHPGTSCRTSCL